MLVHPNIHAVSWIKLRLTVPLCTSPLFRTSLKRGVEYIARPERTQVNHTSYKKQRTIGTYRSEGEAALEVARFVAGAQARGEAEAASAPVADEGLGASALEGDENL